MCEQNLLLITRLKSCSYYYIGVLKKYLSRTPQWLFMYVFGRFSSIQIMMLNYYQRQRTAKVYEEKDSVFSHLNTDEVVKSLIADGLYLGIHLPDSWVREIREFAERNNCYGDGNLRLSFAYQERLAAQSSYGQSFRLGKYYNASLLCPAIEKLARDPKLLNIAAKYLKVESVHAGSWLWWSFPPTAAIYESTAAIGQVFHHDLEDYRCLRFYFYLSDTTLANGPHVCIRGSHRQKKLAYLLSLWRLRSEQDVIDYYGTSRIVTICGPAGFGFVEDPFCVHKGLPPTKGDRLILAIHFSINDYGVLGDRDDSLLLNSSQLTSK
ncbi:hypothetical protein IQ272_10395 [Chroococcidiopsidales cyanobacterium LEGE 13417]|nr:hypothetical protein [Chroococcidiopsidales cyanobacterium LEGE 13417]